MEDQAATGASGPVSIVTGGSKPLHRFLKGQPKCIGVVLVMMGVCLVMFGIATNVGLTSQEFSFEETWAPFWLGTLFFICGVLYILSERNPSKKIITASFALSIISTISVFSACVEFGRSISYSQYKHWSLLTENQTEEERRHIAQHYMTMEKMEIMFLCHSLIGGILLVTMTFLARAALQSSRTQAVVVMRSLPSAE